jgi:hypothetical protein
MLRLLAVRALGTRIAVRFVDDHHSSNKELMFMRYAVALSLLVAFASAAQAQDPNSQFLARDARGNVVAKNDGAGFGAPRQWVLSTDAELSFRRTTLSGQSGAATTLTIAPGVDYFIIPNLSLGGGVGIYYTKAGHQNATTFSIGPRVGYNFEISRLFSVWPKLGFSYSHANQDAAIDRANSLAINIFVPIMVHPAKHFTAGFGPFVDADLSGDTRATSWGFKLTIGGWLNSKPKPNPPTPAVPQP